MNNYSLSELIKSDLYRYCGKFDLKSFCSTYFKNPAFRFTVWLRICYIIRKNRFRKLLLLPFTRIFYNHYKYKYGYDIPYSISIGPGLLIFHFGGIVFNPSSCGKNMTLSHCTTVGMTIINGEKYFPVIKDNVYLAPGSKVIGNLTIESNCAIGTNAVVTKSTNENDVLVGIPAKVISSKGASAYINNPV